MQNRVFIAWSKL